jgi:hypothetical protein
LAAAAASVRLESGRLSNDELAAIAVAVSALSVASRLEAEERALAEASGVSGTGSDAWTDAAHRLQQGHRLRSLPSDNAWVFSDR